jgi:ABC-type antimicrobial peptide transport system permease subunit
MKFAYFNPTVMAVEDVPADIYVQLQDMVSIAHGNQNLDDSKNPNISIRGGQQIQLLPNEFNLDVSLLKSFVEKSAKEYLDNILKINGKSDFDPFDVCLVSAWTIRQTSGDYQALHSHEAHISGNIYLDVPDLAESKPSDANLEFRFPVIRNPGQFVFVDQWKFKPQVMKMVIFPSYIPHTVYPWTGQGYRTILAWDVKLVNKN